MPSYEDSKKATLDKMRHIGKQIKTKEDLIKIFECKGESTTTTYDKLPVSGGSEECKVMRYAELIANLRMEIDKSRRELTVLAFEIEMTISKIKDPISRILLERRYMLGESWKEIAIFLGKTTEYTQGRLRDKAIKQINSLK